jgi:hypothetical protein
MPLRECYHCKQLIEEGQPHDCWTTTESALTVDLSEDLQDAYERLRESAASLGEQRIYASHNSFMFSRKSCYFFVRPKRSFLEVCVFLGRPVNAPQVRRVVRSSKTKLAHLIQIRHRDEVEAPLTDWLEEAYRLQDTPHIARSARTARSAKTGKAGKVVKSAKARKVTPRRKATAATAKASRKKATRPARRRT